MKRTQKQAIAVGAGLAAVAAAAVGAYYLTGKNAGNRKKIAKWAKDMQKEVAEEVSNAAKVTKSSYNKIVDQVAKRYEDVKSVSAPELGALALDLKRHWDVINAEMSAAGQNIRKVVPKTVRSVSKTVRVNQNNQKAPAKKAPAKKAAKKTR